MAISSNGDFAVMKLADMTIEGLTPIDVDRIKAALDADAEAQYRRLTKSAILIEKFKPQIIALRRSGFPWTQIAMKLEYATGKSISASAIRNYLEHHQRPTNRRTATRKFVAPYPDDFATTDLRDD
jgi:MoaA/NifB/PqqE/SkfB family radical SAM enzyme